SFVSGTLIGQAATPLLSNSTVEVDMADGSKPGSSSEPNPGILLVGGVVGGAIFGIVVGTLPEGMLQHWASTFGLWLFLGFLFTSFLVYSQGWKTGLLRGLQFSLWILMVYLVPLARSVFTD